MLDLGSTRGFIRGLLTVLLLLFGAAPARAELLLFYSFNDNTDESLAIDESGRCNDGIIHTARYTDAGGGRTGADDDRAVDFLTTADATYLEVPSAARGAFDSMTANDAATVTMWLYGADNQPV